MTELPRTKEIRSRIDEILDQCRGKSVLHIGFTDAPFTEERFPSGGLLHQKVMKVAKVVHGIDVATKEIDFLQRNGIPHIQYMSVYDLGKSASQFDTKFDVLIFTEVIEHVSNPGQALTSILEFVKQNNPSASLIITAPNVNSFVSMITNAFRNKENVHPDHYFYYSYVTLKKLVEDCGFSVNSFKYVTYGLRPIAKPVAQLLNFFSSSFMPSLMFELKAR
jgi:hypothetical protein